MDTNRNLFSTTMKSISSSNSKIPRFFQRLGKLFPEAPEEAYGAAVKSLRDVRKTSTEPLENRNEIEKRVYKLKEAFHRANNFKKESYEQNEIYFYKNR